MQDHFQGTEASPVPSWVRAHLLLEQEFEQLDAEQRELERLIDSTEKKRIQVGIFVLGFQPKQHQRIGISGPYLCDTARCMCWQSFE